MSELHSSDKLTDADFLTSLRGDMLKFARLQLGPVHEVEDVVQDALLGALRNKSSYTGQAALKTWVFAILKNKIVDHIRRRHKFTGQVLLTNEDDASKESDMFDQHGEWREEARPADWGNPEVDMLGKEFWRIFDVCLNHLPPMQGRVFMMREMMDMETAEICQEVCVSMTNLNVLLFRARLKLRQCLDRNWFAKGEREPC